MNMRPYVVESIMCFAAGMCVGAFLENRRKAPVFLAEQQRQTAQIDELATQEIGDIPKEEAPADSKGVFVSMEDGKIIIDPSKRKKRRLFG